MRPYATTIYQLFILFIGSVFTMTSCEPVNEQTSFNNLEPMTGFEHTVTFDFQGIKMDIVIRKDACSLSTTMGERLLTYGVKKMPSAYPE
ncbi:RTX iron-regulated FrpC family protein, partial [Neisseria meningitidis]|uniref:RTX iron-regulated FrpC family protein n=1 Tax=Neisseria meningitidis TaxID=487 RepID=UPI002FCE4152|nr:hypothetical protein [Neisseria meningitidis]